VLDLLGVIQVFEKMLAVDETGARIRERKGFTQIQAEICSRFVEINVDPSRANALAAS